mgnify:CR=1 FL=1
MKTALCFFGQPRDVIGCYNNIVKNIIMPNSIEDIFIHVWWRPEFEMIGYSVNTDNSGRRSYMTRSFLNFINDNYKPKKILIGNDLEVKFHSSNDISKDCNISASLDRLFPMFYSRQTSCYLKNEYKKETGINYDAVIIIRFDDYIKREIKLENFDLSVINVPVLWSRNLVDINYVSDIITFGNEKNIDIYCDIYSNIPKISFQITDRFISERIIGEWFKMNKINFLESIKYPEDIVMYRDK